MPFTVQELYETLIPYRHHRRELGIETNQDYEIAMSRLLSGERDYLLTDQAMRDKLEAEVQSGHGDPGAFREFAGTKVSLAPEALRRIRALTASGDAPAPPLGDSKAAPAALSSMINASVPEGCRFCGETLPEGRTVIYCPHCGNNLSISRCPACGSELEKGWKFCATCGRSVGA